MDLSPLPDFPEHRDYLFIELAWDIPCDMWSLVGPIRIPILMIEYVKTGPEIADGLERHLDHLLMAMASATAFNVFLKIDLPVFGFLIDRTRVLVYTAWPAETSDAQRVKPFPFRHHV
jgi:hypothetical protein